MTRTERVPITQRQFKYVAELMRTAQADHAAGADENGQDLVASVNAILAGHDPVVRGAFVGVSDDDHTYHLLIETDG